MMNDDLDDELNEIKADRKNYKRRRKSFDVVDFLIALLLLAMLLMLVVGILMVSFPVAAKDTAETIFAPSGGIGKAISNVGGRAKDGYVHRIKPIIVRIKSAIPLSRKKSKKSRIVVEKFDSVACFKCHPDMFNQEVNDHIAVNHRLHDANEVVCEACHISTRHPKPKTVSEKICVDCHKKSGAEVECTTCHTPGSILDDRLISSASLAEFLESRTADKKVLVPKGFEHPVDYQNQPCKQCHNVPEFCTRCHSGMRDGILSSPHDGNWIPTHGPRVLNGDLTITGCWQCHNSLFCAGACHPNPFRQRISPKWPLPKLELP